MPLADWQQRVVDEKRELDIKKEKLFTFIAKSPDYKALDERHRIILRTQYQMMHGYSSMLRERIMLFDGV